MSTEEETALKRNEKSDDVNNLNFPARELNFSFDEDEAALHPSDGTLEQEGRGDANKLHNAYVSSLICTSRCRVGKYHCASLGTKGSLMYISWAR